MSDIRELKTPFTKTIKVQIFNGDFTVYVVYYFLGIPIYKSVTGCMGWNHFTKSLGTAIKSSSSETKNGK